MCSLWLCYLGRLNNAWATPSLCTHAIAPSRQDCVDLKHNEHQATSSAHTMVSCGEVVTQGDGHARKTRDFARSRVLWAQIKGTKASLVRAERIRTSLTVLRTSASAATCVFLSFFFVLFRGSSYVLVPAQALPATCNCSHCATFAQGSLVKGYSWSGICTGLRLPGSAYKAQSRWWQPCQRGTRLQCAWHPARGHRHSCQPDGRSG